MSREEQVRRILDVDDAKRAGDVGRLMQLLRHGVLSDMNTRCAAIRALGGLNAAEAVDLLTDYVTDTDESTRIAAIVALRKIGSADAARHFISALSDVDRVAWSAADALAEIRSKEAVPALAALLEKRSNWWVRRSAARALAFIGGPDSMAALSRAKQSERNLLRRRTLSALVRQATRVP